MNAPLAGYKTYVVAGLAILGALFGALDGDLTWVQAANAILVATLAATLRNGIKTDTAKLKDKQP